MVTTAMDSEGGGTLPPPRSTKDPTPDPAAKLDQLVQAGVFQSRSEAASFLIDEGIKGQTPLFDRVQQKLLEIERLRSELRGMVDQRPV